MTDNKTLIKAEFEEFKGQIVITDSHDTQRLIAIVDGHDDYYWVYYNGRKLSLHSCVGGFIPLKGKIDEKHYNNLVRLAKLNHYDLVVEKNDADLLRSIRQSLTNELCVGNELMADICWTIS